MLVALAANLANATHLLQTLRLLRHGEDRLKIPSTFSRRPQRTHTGVTSAGLRPRSAATAATASPASPLGTASMWVKTQTTGGSGRSGWPTSARRLRNISQSAFRDADCAEQTNTIKSHSRIDSRIAARASGPPASPPA